MCKEEGIQYITKQNKPEAYIETINPERQGDRSIRGAISEGPSHKRRQRRPFLCSGTHSTVTAATTAAVLIKWSHPTAVWSAAVVFSSGRVIFGVSFFFCLTFTFQLLDKQWPQVWSLFPPGTCLQFLSRTGFSIPNEWMNEFPLLVDFHRMLLTHALLALSAKFWSIFYARKSPYEYVHWVRIELTRERKWI